MKVKIAKNSGFCFGVKRAINMAMEAAKKNPKIVTFGPLIHNPQMVEKLEQAGISLVNDISEIKDRPTIIRSHGIEKDIMEEIKKKGIEIINATCPYVSKTHEYARHLNEEGYQIIIFGDQNHPEVIALKSYVKGDAIIVDNVDDLPDKKIDKIGIISQTTRNIETFQELIKALVPKCDELRIINTICSATSIRQKSTLKLAKESDLMIVIGGKNSSNTKMLAKISSDFIKTHHIELADEIEKKWLIDKENIGITAGASTPDWIIVEVYNKILKCIGNSQKQIHKVEDIPGFKEEGNNV